MPITLQLDLLDPAAYDDDSDDGRKICRVGLAEGIPSTTPASVLPEALTAAGMPAIGEGHPIVPACKLRRRVVRPVDAGDKARIELYYETGEVGGTPSGTFVIRDSTALQSELVELDGEFRPIVVDYDTGGANITTKPLRTPRLTPMRTLSVFGTVENRPSITTQLTVGKVNDRTWQGLPKGFWLCSGLEATSSDAVGAVPVVTVAVTFVTRCYRDWSEYGFFVDTNGEIPGPDEGIDAEAIKSVMEEIYTFGQVRTANGFTKVGHYQVANFAGIFGI